MPKFILFIKGRINGHTVCLLNTEIGSKEARDNVTRFVEISLLWQNFKGPWAFLDCLFSIRQTFVPTMAFLCYWANCHCCKWPKIEK